MKPSAWSFVPPPTCSWRSPRPSPRVWAPPPLASWKLRPGLGAAARSPLPALRSAPAAGRTGPWAWPPSHGNPPLQLIQLPEGNSSSLKRRAWRERSAANREVGRTKISSEGCEDHFAHAKLSAGTCKSLNAHLRVPKMVDPQNPWVSILEWSSTTWMIWSIWGTWLGKPSLDQNPFPLKFKKSTGHGLCCRLRT